MTTLFEAGVLTLFRHAADGDEHRAGAGAGTAQIAAQRSVSVPGVGVLLRKDVGEYESVALDDFAHAHFDGTGEYRRVINEGVEFSVLAARVDARGQGIEQGLIVIAAGEGTVDLSRVDAGDLCFHAGGDHIARQLRGRDFPYRKQRFEAGAL